MDENANPPGENNPGQPSQSVPPPPRPVPPPLAARPVIVSAPPRRCTGWKVFALISFTLFLGTLLLIPLSFLGNIFGGGSAPLQAHHKVGPRLQEGLLEDHGSRHKVAVIPIEGIITSQSFGRQGYNLVELVEDQFERAAEDSRVKAVILKVNSPGGEVLASDDINKIIADFQADTGKPVVASMGSLAASGGYYVSAACQWIVANEMTITGSIGVIMAGWNYRGLMDKVGLRPEVFKSGKYKDMLSGEKRPEEITSEEREMVQSLVNETFDEFKTVVREGRAFANQKNSNETESGRTLINNWEQYADGRILSGKEAYRNGFVDELGNFDVALERARKLAGIPSANVIQYEQVFDLSDLLGMFGQTESRALKVDFGIDVPKLQTGRLYFLCPLVLPR